MLPHLLPLPLPCPLLRKSSTRSRTIRNRTSARVSVPSLLYEEPPTDPSRPWVWRTNLSLTKPFWENWFIGLSRKFLEARGGKLLVLAGTDRLDKELMIGQMQGMLHFYPLYIRSSFVLIFTRNLCSIQESSNSKSSRKQDTSSKRTSQRKRHRSWWIFISGMIGVRWCFRPRWLICRPWGL